MKAKRVLSLALSAALAGALLCPAALAANSTEITAKYEDVEIAVTVSDKGNVIINPYGLDYKFNVGTEASPEYVTIANQQIASAPMVIKNNSAMKLSVSASVTATLGEGSELRFATTPTEVTGSGTEGEAGYVAPATSKTLFAALQVGVADGVTGADAAADVNAAYATWASQDFTYDEEKDVVVGAREATLDNIVTLKAATEVSSALQAVDGGIAFYRLAGVVAQESRSPWNAETDTFNVNVAFTFRPAAKEYYTIKLAATTGLDSFTIDGTAYTGDDLTALTTTGVKVLRDKKIEIDADPTDNTKDPSFTAKDAANVAVTIDRLATPPFTSSFAADSVAKDAVVTVTVTLS